MKQEPRQFAIYSRKSRFTGKGESIDNQVELCRRYIAAHGSWEEAEAGRSPYSGRIMEYEYMAYNHSMDRRKVTGLFAVEQTE